MQKINNRSHVTRTKICDFKFKEAKDAISGTEQAYFKEGVWNPWELRDTDEIMQRIDKSGYGAIVEHGDDGMYYVSLPSGGDMW